jgi:hypothetical protein
MTLIRYPAQDIQALKSDDESVQRAAIDHLNIHLRSLIKENRRTAVYIFNQITQYPPQHYNRWNHFRECKAMITGFSRTYHRFQMIICRTCAGIGARMTHLHSKRMSFSYNDIVRDILGISENDYNTLRSGLETGQGIRVAAYLNEKLHQVVESDPDGLGRTLMTKLDHSSLNEGGSSVETGGYTRLQLPDECDDEGIERSDPDPCLEMRRSGDPWPRVQYAPMYSGAGSLHQVSQGSSSQGPPPPHHHGDDVPVQAQDAQAQDAQAQDAQAQEDMVVSMLPDADPLRSQQQQVESSTVTIERVLRTIDASGRGQRFVARLKLDDCCSLLLLENPLPPRIHEMIQQHLYSSLHGSSDIGTLIQVLHRFSDHKSCIENIVSRLGEEQCLGLLLSETNPLPNATLDMIEDRLVDACTSL